MLGKEEKSKDKNVTFGGMVQIEGKGKYVSFQWWVQLISASKDLLIWLLRLPLQLSPQLLTLLFPKDFFFKIEIFDLRKDNQKQNEPKS